MGSVTKRVYKGHAFAYGLREVRRVVGGTQVAEALRVGVSWRTWIRWEHVETQVPLMELEGVAERWRVSLDELLVAPSRERLAGLRLEQVLRQLVGEHGVDAVREAMARALG